jgi:hypothetical protein
MLYTGLQLLPTPHLKATFYFEIIILAAKSVVLLEVLREVRHKDLWLCSKFWNFQTLVCV